MCERQTPAEQMFNGLISQFNKLNMMQASISPNQRGYCVTCVQLMMGAEPRIKTPDDLVDYVLDNDSNSLPAAEFRRVVNSLYPYPLSSDAGNMPYSGRYRE